MKRKAFILIIINIIVWIIFPFLMHSLGSSQRVVVLAQRVSSSERARVLEELSMAVNQAQTDYYTIKYDDKQYKKSEPYFKKSSEKTIAIADAFVINCINAIDSESGNVNVKIIKVIDDKGEEIINEQEISNYKNDKGFIVGWYQYNESKLYYGFIINIDTGDTAVSNKGAKTNKETLLESEQEERILYPTVESVTKKTNK